MLVFIINVCHIFLLINVIIKIIKRKQDSSLLWILISLMYFISIPLFFDAFGCLIQGSSDWELSILEYNPWWERGFIDSYLLDMSLKSLIFNVLIICVYNLISDKKNNTFVYNENNINDYFLPWWLCYTISYLGFVLFLLNYSLLGFNFSGNKIVNLCQGMFITIAPLGLVKGLFKKQYLLGIGTILPVVAVALMFEARARIISLAFVILYYYLWKSSISKFKWKNLLILIILGFSGTLLLTVMKGADGASYPFVKDVSYSHLFYFYEHSESVYTKCTNFLRLLFTGIYSLEVEDITFKLADYKFFVGWGTLHPTMLGWALIDLKERFWLLAIWLGVFLGFSDRLRYKLPKKYNIIYVSFIFVFVSVCARGSVQYAYAAIVYPFFCMLIYLFYYKRIKKK